MCIRDRSAEREQGITIDVAYRYFNTEDRKFIIGDAPGHEQYTRNMVTAASSADAAVVLVDATKLDWQNLALELLVQTRRHSLLCKLLRVPSIVFAVNKLDAVAHPAWAFAHIRRALAAYDGLGAEALRENYRRFLEEVVPAAEDLGMRLCVHPDDPPLGREALRGAQAAPRVCGTGGGSTSRAG